MSKTTTKTNGAPTMTQTPITRTRRQSLRQALALIRAGRMAGVTRCGLAGCPEGGWPETAQARRRMAGELPCRADRTYTVDDLIAALYVVHPQTRRYEWRG